MNLKDLHNNVIIEKNFLTFKECISWLQRVPAPFLVNNEYLPWEFRRIDLPSNHKIIQKVENYWNTYFNVNYLKIKDATLQLWPIDGYSKKHVHTNQGFGREGYTYNSLLYLNNNYEGGEFFTDEICIKPTPGMLTFFDGRITYHGVKKVKLHNRYTLIFWFE